MSQAAGTQRSFLAKPIVVCVRWPVLEPGILPVWLSLWLVLVRRVTTIAQKSTRRYTRLVRATTLKMGRWWRTTPPQNMICPTRASTPWYVMVMWFLLCYFHPILYLNLMWSPTGWICPLWRSEKRLCHGEGMCRGNQEEGADSAQGADTRKAVLLLHLFLDGYYKCSCSEMIKCA